MLVHRERLANSLKVDQLKAMFTEVIEEWGDHANFGFNPEVKYS